ncbi:MAG: hypothetical protein BROFUL_01359 [Candidatus Brocadia fulgida]|uniref:Uncharacterized protein n=1 Tax=Candidatus Brocadia fulgida TaxID=380242 RepID=A0A0M2UWH4_9BACT|nr:MAG: hypothetical protein BROFUL_01359 [Candidatus Brocadia fulgida]
MFVVGRTFADIRFECHLMSWTANASPLRVIANKVAEGLIKTGKNTQDGQ